MNKAAIQALFDNAIEHTDVEYEYARKMLYCAYYAFLDSDFDLCAFEIRSFPMEVFCPTELEEWAKSFHTC